MTSKMDIGYLEMAYALAERAKGWASPNPYVGAVIVNRGNIVGFGYHEKPGRPHAEAIALQRAGASANSSTVYLTLEPCIHWGRTPPCIDSLLGAGPKRVVISSRDPNPRVYRKGIQRLRQAGIDVSVGLLKEKNKSLNETYNKYITQKVPFVTIKAALSLDGKIATKTYSSKWITSSTTREYVHLLRGEYDSIMVGINTLLKDDPLLTIRHPHWRNKKITRIILDSRLRFPLDAAILGTLSQGKILVFTLKTSSQKKADVLRKKGVHVIAVDQSRLNLKKVLSWLAKHETASVFVEGGGQLITSLIEERLADKIYLAISPKLIGGEIAPSFFQGAGVNRIPDALRLKKINTLHIDDEIIIEGYI